MPSPPGNLPPLSPVVDRVPADVLRIAHRGGNFGAEDYRTAHMRRIAELGTHLVEFDIRVTADGVLVVHHDAEVSRRDQKLNIAAHPLDELTNAGNDDGLLLAATVVRSIVTAGLGAYVDIKDITESGAASLVELLDDLNMLDRTILASTEIELLAHCVAVAPKVPRAVLLRSPHEDPIPLARVIEVDFLHPCWENETTRPDRLVAGPWLSRVREHGLGVICWHEERPEVLSELLAIGVDGICTDDPGQLTRLAEGASP